MLFGADTKELDGAGKGKNPLNRFLRRGWHEKPLFSENAWRDYYKKARLTQNVR